MIRTRTFQAGVLIVLLFFLPLYSQVARAQEVPCDNSQAKSVIPANKKGQPLMPEEIQNDAEIMNKLKGARLKLKEEDIRRCLRNDKPLINHVIDFDSYAAVWNKIKDSKPALRIEDSILWSFEEEGLVSLATFGRTAVDADGKTTLTIHVPIQWKNVTLGPSFSVWKETIYKIKRGRLRRKIQEKRQTVEFLLGTSFQNSRFPTRADFSKATFVAGASFSGATFGGRASFDGATFGDRASFSRATFGDRVSFSRATFYKRASFGGATFGDRAFFSVATFDKLAFFPGATFGANAFFFGATFGAGAFFDGATFDKLAFFSRATFGDHASFKRATFGDRAFFKRATFGDRAFFFEAEFCAGASFDGATFRADISLRSATVNGELNLVSTNWEGRADFRESIIQDLFWDSNDRPSGVKGVFDAREATFGKVTIKDVHFSDLVDFSDAEFGRSGNNSSDDDKPRTDSCGRKTDKSSPEQPGHESEKIIFEHTIFEKEVDFLRAEFWNDAIFVRNRFRGVWDLTDATFERKEGQDKKGEQEEEEKNSHLCLSFNRIGKLFMGRNHLGYESSWTKDFFPDLLPLTALKKSRIRGVIGDEEYSCARVNESREKNENEDLWEIYGTIESSFREVNDRLAENEAWYLRMVAEQESQYSDVKDWVSWIAVEYWAFLILKDIPSRYGIDLCRVVLVSICLVLFFAIFYAYYFRRQIRINKRKQYVKLKPRPDQKRAFRFRPFERFFQSWQTWERQERPLHPCKDALFLSGRAFFKLGLGTAYPRTRMLVGIAIVEWIAGMYMLIHFLFVVRNTSPIAVPFLGVAG